MSASPTLVATPTTVSAPTGRIASIDVFRGLTMMVMIFVNDLSDVRGLPWWTYHAHMQWNVMTYVDMVFPFFLFIVGMSMPIAIAGRLKRNPSYCCALATHSLALHWPDCFGIDSRECRKGRSGSDGTTDSRLGAAWIDGCDSLLARPQPQYSARSNFSCPADRGISGDRRRVCDLSQNNARRRGLD